MSLKLDDIFHSNSVLKKKEPNASIGQTIDAIRCASRNVHRLFYIVDYCNQEYLSIYDGQNWLGLHLQKTVNIHDIIGAIPESDHKIIKEINDAILKFYKDLPKEEKKEYTASCDFNIAFSRQTRLVNRTFTPMTIDDDGNILHGLCSLSLSSMRAAGNVSVRKANEDNVHVYSLETHKWYKERPVKFNHVENEVIILSARGFTVEEIANRTYKSIDTIKSAKRKIFSKIKANNIAKVVASVLILGLI